MAAVRKMLGKADSPYILSLMRLIETQSKETLANWALDYTEKHILPIYLEAYPEDLRPVRALDAAREWLAGRQKLPAVKKLILDAHAAAREAADSSAAQAAARTAGQAAATIHTPTHALGLAFYGAAAIAYHTVGTKESDAVYEEIAMRECAKMEEALSAVAVKDEPNPAKINWYC